MNLFGEPEPVEEKKEVAHVGPHKALIEFWCAAWSLAEGGKYPFRPRDASYIKQIAKVCGGDGRAREVIMCYLACEEPYFRGHDLAKLLNQLGRFCSEKPRPHQRISERGKLSASDPASIIIKKDASDASGA